MAGLAVETEILEKSVVPVFQQCLGRDFDQLSPAGRARFLRGRSPWSRFLAGLFGFPAASQDTAVTVAMTPQNSGELWKRRFGGKPFCPFLKIQGDRMVERFGPMTFTLGLHIADGQLFFLS